MEDHKDVDMIVQKDHVGIEYIFEEILIKDKQMNQIFLFFIFSSL
jgi:hypothetical protein